MPLSTTSPTTSILFLTVLILAFFPNLFIGLLKVPFKPFLSAPSTTPPAYPTPTCSCPCICASSSTTTSPPSPTMSWTQKTIALPSKSRGSYLITDHVVSSLPEIKNYKVGLLNLFVQHTSCALSLNENWDQDVRADMSDALDRIVPEDKAGKGLYRHDAEGSDDMPVSLCCTKLFHYGIARVDKEMRCGVGGVQRLSGILV
jgi:secondary thiamine-phosphate synthase enzyme